MIYLYNETKYLPNLSNMKIGTQIQCKNIPFFLPIMMYVRFELKSNNLWSLIMYTEGININKSAWKEYPTSVEFSSEELTKLILSSKDKYPLFQMYIPRKNKDDFNGIVKYFDKWIESDFGLNNTDLKIYSLENILNDVNKNNKWKALEYLIYLNHEHKNKLRYSLGGDKYIIFNISKEELRFLLERYGYDIDLIRHRELIYS